MYVSKARPGQPSWGPSRAESRRRTMAKLSRCLERARVCTCLSRQEPGIGRHLHPFPYLRGSVCTSLRMRGSKWMVARRRCRRRVESLIARRASDRVTSLRICLPAFHPQQATGPTNCLSRSNCRGRRGHPRASLGWGHEPLAAVCTGCTSILPHPRHLAILSIHPLLHQGSLPCPLARLLFFPLPHPPCSLHTGGE